MKRKILSLFFALMLTATLFPLKAFAQFGYGIDIKAAKESLDMRYSAPWSFPQSFSLKGGGDKGTLNLFIPILPPLIYFPLGTVTVTHNGLLDEEIKGIDAAIGGSFLFGMIPIEDIPVPIPFGEYEADITPLGMVKKQIQPVDKTEGIIISMLLAGSKAELDLYVDLPLVNKIDQQYVANAANPSITIPIIIPLGIELPDGIEIPEDTEIPDMEIQIDITLDFEFSPMISTLNLTIETKSQDEAQQPPPVPIPIPIPNGSYYVKLKPEIIEPTGSIQVTLWPSDIRSEGQWRIVGESTWRKSGEIAENFEKGLYEIEFSPVSGWISPSPLDVLLPAGQDVSSDGFYTKTPPPVDVEGYNYKTISIGEQEWFAENLRTTKYRDGTSIENVVENTAWKNNTAGAYAWYNNKIENRSSFGALYNWHAVYNSKGICPPNWRVPEDDDWQKLLDYLGGDDMAGAKLKERGIKHWKQPNTGTNESGFTARGGGFRPEDGPFPPIAITGFIGQFWSLTEDGASPDKASTRTLVYSESSFSPSFQNKNMGLSVRCIKE